MLTSNKSILFKVKTVLSRRLKWLGLSLNQEKTKLVHKSEGFNFLGFHLIQYPGHTLWLQADKSSIKRVLHKIKNIMDTHKQVKTDGLIYSLNKIILGWARYFQYCRSYNIFANMDGVLFRWTWNWCRRRHPHKIKRWIKNKYFTQIENRNWTLFGEIWHLNRFSDIKRKIYSWKVGNKSYLNPEIKREWKCNEISDELT